MSRRRAVLLAAATAVLALAACSTTSANASGRLPALPPWISPQPLTSASAASPKPPVKPTPTPPKKPTPSKTPTSPSTGLYHPGPSKIPVWPTANRYRGPLGSQGNTGTNAVALTFDDGPGPFTAQFLDVLDAYHVKATFCLIGRQIHHYEAVVRRMIADGMTICNHSWDHNESLGRLSGPIIWTNLAKVNAAVRAISPDTNVSYFRHPGGNFTRTAISVCEEQGMRPLYWNVDTEDWTRPGIPAIERSLAHDVHSGSVVLMHDGGGDRSQTLAALTAMLPMLKAKYRLIALPSSRTVTVIPPPRPGPGPTRTPTPTLPPSVPPSLPPSPPPSTAPAS